MENVSVVETAVLCMTVVAALLVIMMVISVVRKSRRRHLLRYRNRPNRDPVGRRPEGQSASPEPTE